MKKVLIGCGVVVGLALIALVVTTVIIGNYVSKNLPDTERIDRLETRLEQEFGAPEEFVPPLDGAYDPARIALYVDLRTRFHQQSQPIVDEVRALQTGYRRDGPKPSRWAQFKTAMSGLRSGMGIFRESVEFLATADSLLLEAGMGKGEYNHYNLITVMAALPDSLRDDLQVDREGETTQIASEFAEGARDMILDQLDNARKAIARLENPTEEQLAWRETLGNELRRCREDRHHWPFSNGTPNPMTSLLDVHRERLEPTLPRNIAEFLAEMPLAMEVETDGGGFQIKF